jgi:hypothetical protein
MTESAQTKHRHLAWPAAALVIAALAGLCGACKKSDQPQVSAGPTTFASPESAGQAVYKAAKAEDTTAILAIFGPDGQDYLLTNDPNQDKSALEQFCADYEQMHRWAAAEDGGESVLDIGAENYPFPFPLIKTSDGQWVFSSDRAKKEMQARVIGNNELTVIDILNEMADAQTEYFATTHDDKVKQYSQRFLSNEGKHDGLYWTVAEGEPESPLGPLAARASAEGYQPGTKESPQPFHGYFYRILKEQGSHADGGAKSYLANGNMTKGFAIMAYPADYRKSGVMTFIIAQDGRVYQKDIGPDTVQTAKAITAFDPDDTWAIVE